MILLSSGDGFLVRMALSSRSVPFWTEYEDEVNASNSIVFANFLLTSVHMGAI